MKEKKTKTIRKKIPPALKRLLSGFVAAAMIGTMPVSVMNVSAVTDAVESTKGSVTFPEGSKGLELGTVESTPGSTVKIPIHVKGADIYSVDSYFTCDADAPLYLNKLSGEIIASENLADNKIGGVFCQYPSWSDDYEIGSITVDISADAKPGKYPIKAIINSMNYAEGGEVKNPVGGIGYVIVPVTTTTAIKGDVSGNNMIDLMDVILVAKYILNPNTLTKEQLKIADFNDNGVVDLIDAIAIAKYMIKH